MNSVWEKIDWSLNREDVLKETIKLIKAGADVNAKCEDGEPPLLKAIFSGHQECAIQLIKAGADVNAKDECGETALMYAAEEGQAECVAQLIKAGADVNAKDEEGKTALMYAAEEGYTECVEQLIEAGADVNAKDRFGETVLMYAAEGHTECACIINHAIANRKRAQVIKDKLRASQKKIIPDIKNRLKVRSIIAKRMNERERER